MKFRGTTLREISGGGTYGLGAAANHNLPSPKFLRTTDIVSGSISWDTVPSCEASDGDIIKYLLQDGDIVISRTGANAGINCLISNPPKDAIFAGYLVRFRIPANEADSRFVSYVLQSQSWQDYVDATRTGSAQPQLNAVLMGNFELSLPELKIQTEIADILESLDEKIRVNQQIASTLQQIAQTIFKSWFVDFDPVRAKARGELPVGIDAETAALFPDSFEESELGPIPAGWTLCNVEGLLKRHSFKSEHKSSEEYGFGSFPIVQQGEPMIAGFGDAEKVLKATPEAPLFVFGDHTCRMMLLNESFVALPNTVVFSSAVDETYWAFHATLGLQKFESYRRHWMELAAKTVVLAPISIQKVFSKTVSTLYQQSWALIHQNRTLEALRDSLLPRLISGELEIPVELLEA